MPVYLYIQVPTYKVKYKVFSQARYILNWPLIKNNIKIQEAFRDFGWKGKFFPDKIFSVAKSWKENHIVVLRVLEGLIFT